MEKSTIIAIFNSYVKLPEGNQRVNHPWLRNVLKDRWPEGVYIEFRHQVLHVLKEFLANKGMVLRPCHAVPC